MKKISWNPQKFKNRFVVGLLVSILLGGIAININNHVGNGWIDLAAWLIFYNVSFYLFTTALKDARKEKKTTLAVLNILPLVLLIFSIIYILVLAYLLRDAFSS